MRKSNRAIRVDFRVSILIGKRNQKQVRSELQEFLRQRSGTTVFDGTDDSGSIHVTVLRRRPWWKVW